MNTLIRIIDRINALTGRAIAWLTLFMVIVTFLVVVLRYLFNTGWIAMQESITYMHALVFMLGAAYTYQRNGHVRVDIFYQRFTIRGRAWVDLLGNLLLLIPFMVFIVMASWDYVAASWSLHESSREAGGLPGVFLLKTSIPLMAAMLLLQAIASSLNKLLIITGHAPANDADPS